MYLNLYNWNDKAYYELKRVNFDLLRLRVQMLDSVNPECLGTLPKRPSRTDFIIALSMKSVRYFIPQRRMGSSPALTSTLFYPFRVSSLCNYWTNGKT